MRAIKRIRGPLSSLVNLKDSIKTNRSKKTEIVEELFVNTNQIAALVDEILVGIYRNQVETQLPLIFDLYYKVPRIRNICENEINPSAISKSDKLWLMDIEKIVLNEINKSEVNLIKLAYQVSVSERQLHRNIKKFLGLTPNNYIRILKLHRAKQHLEEFTYRTISEVSYAVGFNDAHYFSKIFFDQYGVKPKDVIRSW